MKIYDFKQFQKPNTWCEKVPKKICAPDFCEMVPGEEKCVDKTIQSTIVRPEEICDLQPSKQCRLKIYKTFYRRKLLIFVTSLSVFACQAFPAILA
jgi:hypothetical protein